MTSITSAILISTSQPVKHPRKMYLRENSYKPEVAVEIEANKNLDNLWREKAEKELGESPEIVITKIKQFQHLIFINNLIPIDGRRDDAFILRFLRAKKFDVDKAVKMMQKYYTMKKDSPEFFQVSPPTQLRDILELQIQLMLPHRDSNGRQIFIFRVEKCDPYKCAVERIFKSNVLALEQAIRDPRTQIGGLVVLLDMAGVGFGHAKFLSPHLSKRTVEVIQETFPMRFKAFHILHEPFYFDAILAVLKPFLKEKIRRRIFTHGNDLNSLHKHIPKEILPIEYGGFQQKFDNQQWRNQIFNDEDYFVRLETFTYDCNNDNNNNNINNNNTNNNTNNTIDDNNNNNNIIDNNLIINQNIKTNKHDKNFINRNLKQLKSSLTIKKKLSKSSSSCSSSSSTISSSSSSSKSSSSTSSSSSSVSSINILEESDDSEYDSDTLFEDATDYDYDIQNTPINLNDKEIFQRTKKNCTIK